MATQNQIEANRRNAANSTGPTTSEGKAKSSMNALKSGIDAKSEILRFESAEDHATLVAEYYERFQPAAPEERCLVDRLIASEWLHRRYSAVEGAVWESEFEELSTPGLGVAYFRASEQLARVDRRLNSAQRNFDKALKELHAIQAKKPAQPPAAETPAGTTHETKPVTPELGSFLISENESPRHQPSNEINRYPADPKPDIPLAA